MGTITVSPRHGAQDVSLTPITHTLFILSLLLPDTAHRTSTCTCFFQTCPISELILFVVGVAVCKRGCIAREPPP